MADQGEGGVICQTGSFSSAWKCQAWNGISVRGRYLTFALTFRANETIASRSFLIPTANTMVASSLISKTKCRSNEQSLRNRVTAIFKWSAPGSDSGTRIPISCFGRSAEGRSFGESFRLGSGESEFHRSKTTTFVLLVKQGKPIDKLIRSQLRVLKAVIYSIAPWIVAFTNNRLEQIARTKSKSLSLLAHLFPSKIYSSGWTWLSFVLRNWTVSFMIYPGPVRRNRSDRIERVFELILSILNYLTWFDRKDFLRIRI